MKFEKAKNTFFKMQQPFNTSLFLHCLFFLYIADFTNFELCGKRGAYIVLMTDARIDT